MINKRQFDILIYLLANDKYVSQRNLAKALGVSLGTVNNHLKKLTKMNYVYKGYITEDGKKALKPYKVERAIFIAADLGSRLLPVTFDIPKPLIIVKGIRIIDTVLDAVLKAGITEIYVVRGYLSENFDILLDKYPMIKFIDNKIYSETNNISSALMVKDKFKNAYVFEGNLLLYNEEIITPYQYSSNYLGIPIERTDSWCLKTKRGRVIGMCLGGENCYKMVGISYWTKIDGEKFEKHIEEVYRSPGGKQRYWEQVILDYNIESYDVSIRKCSFNDIEVLDTFRELQEIDSKYSL